MPDVDGDPLLRPLLAMFPQPEFEHGSQTSYVLTCSQ